jgi:hypothetical protein
MLRLYFYYGFADDRVLSGTHHLQPNKKYMRSTMFFTCCFFFMLESAYCQGKVGINTTTPAAMLHVKDSSVVFTGINPLPGTPGVPPVSGAGTRMMWYPDKAAFRVGSVLGTQWNKDSIGNFSFVSGIESMAKGYGSAAIGYNNSALGNTAIAIGYSNLASGHYSLATGTETIANGNYGTAMGFQSIASGIKSTALGNQSLASGEDATAMGNQTIASANSATALGTLTIASGISAFAAGSQTTAGAVNSVAMGQYTKASGVTSFAMGYETKAIGAYSAALGYDAYARPFSSFAMGRYNDTTSLSANSWNTADPVFMVGIGASNSSRANAMTILKNGNVSIGPDVSPTNRLLISSNDPADGGWVEGIMVENTNANTGEASVAIKNTAIPVNKQWIVGLNQNPTLAFNYGTNFAGGNNKMVIDTFGNVGIGMSSPATDLHIKGAIAMNNYENPPYTSVSNNDPIDVGDRTYIRVSTGTVSGGQDISVKMDNGIAIGQILILQRIEGIANNNLLISDSEPNIDIAGTFVILNVNDTITFIWDGDEWVELHRSNN